MLSLGILSCTFIAYWFGHYEAAFWITVLCMANGALAALAALANPNWYLERRMAALPDEGITSAIDLRDQIRHFVITKVAITAVGTVAAWYFGRLAGYF